MTTARDRFDPVGSDPKLAVHEDDEPTPSVADRGARQRFHDLGREVVDAARNQARDQHHRAAGQVDGLAEALHQAAERLDERIKEATALLSGLADGLRERDPDEVWDGTERFARQQPALFVGAAVAAGFLLSRFIKSSAGRPGGERAARDREAGEQTVGLGCKDRELGGATELTDTARAGLSYPPSHDAGRGGKEEAGGRHSESHGSDGGPEAGGTAAPSPLPEEVRSDLPASEPPASVGSPSTDRTPAAGSATDPESSSDRLP